MAIASCATGNASNHPFILTVAYVSKELPGSEYDIDQLTLNLEAINELYDFEFNIQQKIYPDREALDLAIQFDAEIDIALIPGDLLLQHRNRFIPPPSEGSIFTYMAEFEEHYPTVLNTLFTRGFNTEEFNSKEENVPPFTKTFVPYSFGHYGVMYEQSVYPLRLRRVTDLLSYVMPEQLKTYNDPQLLNYLASILAFEEELDQAFQLYNTDQLNLHQYQSLVSSYLNSSSGRVLSTLNGLSTQQLIDLDASLVGGADVIIGPSHILGRNWIKEDYPYRFEYLIDANLMYFDGFAFLNDHNLEAYSLFVDALYQPEQLVKNARVTHKTIMGDSAALLDLFAEATSEDGLLQSDFTFYFDATINQTNNMIFDYDSDSLLATLYPNQQVMDSSIIKVQNLTSEFITKYRERFNPSYGIVPTTADWLAIFLWVSGSSLVIGTGYFGITYYSKKMKKTNKQEPMKPYKILKMQRKNRNIK